MSEPFIAEIRIFAGNFAPRGWAFCDGQLIAVSQNEALFALVGTIYGGDGRTTFGLPDLRGRAPVHEGTGPGLSSRQQGQKGGAETVTLTAQQIPSHTHSLQASTGLARSASPANDSSLARSRGGSAYAPAASLVPMDSGSLSPAGGSQSHDNMQPFLALYYIIALTGIFPSRS